MIFLDTNVISETLKHNPEPVVMNWLAVHDAELAIPTVTLAEIAYGIEKIRPDQRSDRLAQGLTAWRERFSGQIHAFTEQAALVYGKLMGEAARSGYAMSVPDGMIAAIVLVNGGELATRNVGDFKVAGLNLINPWEG
ncbi:MAG: type II toxin-antitoxin system VapC family toxin [Wenzhouxiangellaceae bacterium]